ncbi:hypothetical protein ACSSS7_005818 [Eimeria intestinalis]
MLFTSSRSPTEPRVSLVTSSRTTERAGSQQGTVLSASSPQVPISTKATRVNSKRWKAASSDQRGASVLKLWGALLLSLIFAVLFMRPLCHRNFESSLAGARLRRLGEKEHEGEGDVPRPTSPDLAELCFALGEWIPNPPSSGGTRESPSLVEAVLAELEAELESGSESASSPPAVGTLDSDLGTSVSGTCLKRLRSEEERGQAESLFPDPSSKVARTHSSASVEQQLPSQSQLVHPSDKESRTGQLPLVQPSAGFTLFFPQYVVFQAADQPSTSSSALLASAGGASASSGPASWPTVPGSDTVPLGKHPFVRLPVLRPGVEPPQISPEWIKYGDFVPSKPCYILRHMRELFLEPELGSLGASKLVRAAQELARHAYVRMTVDVSRFKPNRAADYMARRFMVLWSLYSASQVLRQDWSSQSWWRELMDRIPCRYCPQWRPHTIELGWNERLALELSEAIQKLKNGEPLPDSVVIDLKRKIFCLPESPFRFKSPWWDLWRDDDSKFPRRLR